MTGSESRKEAKVYLEEMEKRLFPKIGESVFLSTVFAGFALALGIGIYGQCGPRDDQTISETPESVEAVVEENIGAAYPGPAPFKTPHRQQVKESAERYGLDECLIEGLMMGSSELNSYYEDIPPEKRSIIALDPERAGVLGRYLKADPRLAIDRAARLYKMILENEDEESAAVARFFAGERSVKRAIGRETERLDGIHDRSTGYERIAHIYVQSELRNKPLNWLEHLSPWQMEATYITLTHVGMNDID